MDTPTLIDFSLVLDNFGGDSELLVNTINLSIKLIPQHLEKIRAAVTANDAKALEISAHTLKGSLGIYLYQPIVSTAFELEKMGRNNNLTHSQETFLSLEKQLALFLRDLSSFSLSNLTPDTSA